jgi:hypothetical protein
MSSEAPVEPRKSDITYFCNEILRRSDPNDAAVKNFFPIVYKDLEYYGTEVDLPVEDPAPFPRVTNIPFKWLNEVRSSIQGMTQDRRVRLSTFITHL